VRDDFPQHVKSTIAQRAGNCCSNPYCGRPTSGPSDSARAVTNVGVAAHIAAASLGGPRSDPAMTTEQRISLDNAIWLCQTCAKMVDDDPLRYTPDLLRSWRVDAEARARESIDKGPRAWAPSSTHGGSPHGQPQSSAILSLKAAKGQQWEVWIEDEIRLTLHLAGGAELSQRMLIAIDHPRRYRVTCTVTGPDRLGLLLEPLTYEYRITTQTDDGVQTQLVIANRDSHGTPQILKRVDTNNGALHPVTDPVQSTLAMNFMTTSLELVINPGGTLLSARTLGDLLDPSTLEGPSSQLLAGMRWMTSMPEAARYIANQLIVATPAQPVWQGVQWATSRDLDIMGLKVKSVGALSVATTSGPLCRLEERGSYQADSSVLRQKLEWLVQTVTGVPAIAEITSPANASYVQTWAYDAATGWPQTMNCRTEDLSLYGRAVWEDGGETREVKIKVDGSATAQSGWEAITPGVTVSPSS
jgi:hypothetical protein